MSTGTKLFLFLLVWLAGIVPVTLVIFMLVGPCPKDGSQVGLAQAIGILWFFGLFVGPVVILASRRPESGPKRRPKASTNKR